MRPDVLYLILCDDARIDPNNLLRINIYGLMTRIRSTAIPPFPVMQPLLSALLVLSGCQGTGLLTLRIVRSEDGSVVFRNRPRPVRFAGDPSESIGITFRVRNCSFPAAGVYWVEIEYDGTILIRQRLLLTD